MGGRPLAVLVVVLAFLLLAPTAAASHDTSGAPLGEDFVTGSFSTGVASLTLDAHSGPLGENPTGTATASDGLGTDTGRVTCLQVAGNRATVGLDFVTAGGGWFFLEDNPGGQDMFAGVGSPGGEPPTDCPTTSPRPLSPIPAGDVVVHDAPTLPTSKEQCKQGGWRDFPGFKSQGQCIAFVLKTRLCRLFERFGYTPRFCPPRPP